MRLIKFIKKLLSYFRISFWKKKEPLPVAPVIVKHRPRCSRCNNCNYNKNKFKNKRRKEREQRKSRDINSRDYYLGFAMQGR